MMLPGALVLKGHAVDADLSDNVDEETDKLLADSLIHINDTRLSNYFYLSEMLISCTTTSIL